MPKVQDQPETLRPYLFHGIDLDNQGDEAVGTCPWCGREDKFTVNIGSGQWRCLVCNEGTETDKAIKGGNATTFIRMLYERSFRQTPAREYVPLANERRLLLPTTLSEIGLCKSVITDKWLLPSFNLEGKVNGLYQWFKTNGRMAWLPTSGFGHQLLGMNLYNPKCDLVYILEGVWDMACFWEVLGMCKQQEDRLVKTLNRDASLLATESVLGLASCQAFNENWVPHFAKKIVVLLGQNDHEKRMCAKCRKSYSCFTYQACPYCECPEITDLVVAPASYTGMERIARLVSPVAEQVYIYNWGEKGYDPALPSGYDQRDLISA